MGYPRSDEERPIRLNHTEWDVFEMLGGVAWLKCRIRHLHKAGYAKRERNNRIRADREAGMSLRELGEKYKLDPSTVLRICKP